jgi:predicted O-linked N-acetylglucosamine transferase (SPINDLY family)
MAQLSIDEAMRIAFEHHQSGRLQEAEQLYRQVLLQMPDHVMALHLLGVIAQQAGRNEIAVDLIRRAVALKPELAPAHYHLGIALAGTGRFDEAIAAYRRSIGLRADHAESHCNLGTALWEKGQLHEAIAEYRKAIAIQPSLADAHYNLGQALRETGQNDEAIAAYRQVIGLNPSHTQAISNLGSVLSDQGQVDAAIACFRQATALDPDNATIHSNLVYALWFHPGYDATSLADEHRRWNDRHSKPLQNRVQPHANDPNPDRRLRIGYVSPDFRKHVVGRNVLPLICHRAREQFEVLCYSNVQRPDTLTAQFRSFADGWRSIVELSDDQAAELIRGDRIDILVDLTLHMNRNRLPIFARKPAPVQVTFAGYPGTTGLDAIDYRLTDPHLDPPGQGDPVYAEESIRLPDTFWCYDPASMTDGISPEPQPGALPALSASFVTFGCLNNFCKVNERVLALWARVLKSVNHSRLIVMVPVGSARQRTLTFLGREGIDSTRIEFVANAPVGEYFRRYDRIDIGLDTFPYNGHTTTLDALWSGVPVVTLVGKTVVGRAGLSQLTNLKLKELMAEDEDQYVRIATELARDLPRLGELRAKLRSAMLESVLTDAPRFARSVEAAYRHMWRRWCQSAGWPIIPK